MPPVLSLCGVTAGYGNIRILHEVTMEVVSGSIVGVFGANGAGKTTLLRTVSGLTEVFSGEIRVGDTPATRLAPYLIARAGVAHVPEGRRVFPGLTVLDNLTIASRRRNAGELLGRVYELFPRLGERRAQRAETMSGGEQQMLAIGRALMMEPRLIMMDEPSQGLSPAAVEAVMQSIPKIASTGVTVIVVEQNVNILLPVAMSAIVVSRGNVRAMESTAHLTKANLAALLTDEPQTLDGHAFRPNQK